MTEPKALKVGILGATGAVGEQMMIVLAERNFPVAELRLFGSSRSAGSKLAFKGKEYEVEEASLERMKGLDLLLGAADNDVAKKFLPDAAKLGVTVVDNSSAFRKSRSLSLKSTPKTSSGARGSLPIRTAPRSSVLRPSRRCTARLK